MPLPTGAKQPWPPTPGAITTKYREWSAWLSGDPDQLGAVYGNTVGTSRTGRAFFTGTGEHPNRRSQYSGGITGIVARLFWGQPVPLGEKRTKLHVPLAGDLAATSSAQLFSKAPTFTAESAKTQQVLDGFLDDGMHATLLEAGEVCSAISGVYLRVAWDKAIADASWTNVVRPDCAVPEWTYGRLTAVTFWRVLVDEGSKVVRHLERHDFATQTIEHGVYEGDQQELGRPVPLEDYEATAPLAKLVTDGGVIVLPEGCPPLVQYVPNIRPNRIWPDLPEAAQLGRSDYSGQETLLDALDEVYSDWMRDVRLAKSRLLVPTDYMQNLGRGQGAVFDSDQEVLVPIKTALGEGSGDPITENQFKIRFEEHQKTAQDLVEQIIRGAGFSAQTFGEYQGQAVTATEVNAKERQTLTTRGRKINYWRPGLADHVRARLFIDQAVFGAQLTPERPEITFPETVQPDPLATAQTAQALYNAKAASTETLVKLVHPDWDEEAVKAEVARIEAQAPVPPPVPAVSGPALNGEPEPEPQPPR